MLKEGADDGKVAIGAEVLGFVVMGRAVGKMMDVGFDTVGSVCGDLVGGAELCCNTHISVAARPLETDADDTVSTGGSLILSVTIPTTSARNPCSRPSSPSLVQVLQAG